jgi:ATP-dependent helicase IRC3
MAVLEIRPYQQEALDAIVAAEARGVCRPLVALPTGTGKTVIFAHVIAGRPGRALILVHRDELVRQAVDKLSMVAPDLIAGIVKAARDDVTAPCIVASVQTVSHESRLARLTADFGTVVVDEAHHAVADSYRRVLTAVGAFARQGPVVLGVTATPQCGDAVGLEPVFQEIVYRKTILDMIRAGYLSDLRAIQIRLAADAPEHVSPAYREHARGRKALLFAPTVAMARAMAETLCRDGIAAEALSGGTPPDARQAMLKRFKAGQTQVIANCAVLTEGFDEPSIDAIVIARPTKSTTLYTQMIGRGTRLYPGKADCLVLDLVGATTRHDLISVATLVGLPLDRLPQGYLVSEAVAAHEAEVRRRQGALVARRVELFQRRPLHWVATDAGFALTLGQQGWMVLTPESPTQEHWAVLRVSRRGATQVVADRLPLAYAQRIAEDAARREGAQGLVNPQARWRQRPIEEYPKMLAWLQRWHLPYHVGMSAGEASDLLSFEQLRRLDPVARA